MLPIILNFLRLHRILSPFKNHEPILIKISTRLCCMGAHMVFPSKKPDTRGPYILKTWGLVGYSQNVPNKFWGLPSRFWRHSNFEVDFKHVMGRFLRCSRNVSSFLKMEIDDWTIWSFIPSTFFVLFWILIWIYTSCSSKYGLCRMDFSLGF